MSLIGEIKKTIQMEIRPTSQGENYLEAVISRKDLERLMALFNTHLGQEWKRSESEMNLPGEIQEIVDTLGGLRPGQSFFFRQEKKKVTFAALWPWESNPDKITIKTGAW